MSPIGKSFHHWNFEVGHVIINNVTFGKENDKYFYSQTSPHSSRDAVGLYGAMQPSCCLTQGKRPLISLDHVNPCRSYHSQI
jgi:hypothetical protein